jgi:hypothetical protein
MPYKDTTSVEVREKLRRYRRDWYARNKETAKVSVHERRELMRAWYRSKKDVLSCVKCGEDHNATLEFHHTDPSEKEISVADAINRGWSIERIETEMAKCVVLCANCHRKEHSKHSTLPV